MQARPIHFVLLLAAVSTLPWAGCAPAEPAALAAITLDPGGDVALSRRLAERRQAVLDRPESAAAWGALGKTLDVHDDPSGAVACYARAAELDGRDWQWPYHMGVLERRGDPQSATAHLERAAELREDYAPVHAYLGELALSADQAAQARAEFERALAIEPRLVRAHLGLGKVALLEDDAAAAVQALEEALEMGARGGEPHYLLAEAYRRLGDETAAAEQDAQYSIDWVPEAMADPVRDQLTWDEGVSLEWRRKRARKHAAAGDLAQLVAEWEALEQLDPTSAVPHAELGDAYVIVGDVDKAVAEWDRAVELAPLNADVHARRGAAMARIGRTQDAIESYQRTLQLDPENLETRGNLGSILFSQGRHEEGIEHMLAVADAQPLNAEARFNAAQGLRFVGRLDEAERAYRRVIELDPERLAAKSALGLTLAMRQRFDEAQAIFEELVELEPNSISSWRNLARVWEERGEWDRALEVYLRGLEANPGTKRLLEPIAWTFATCSDPTVRDGESALVYAQELAGRGTSKVPAHLDILAAAAAEKGDFGPAQHFAQKAIDLLTEASTEQDAELRGQMLVDIQKRLELYKQNKPFHQEP